MFKIKQLSVNLDMDDFYKNYVDIKKFHKLCEKCENYGTNWSCPPFNFDKNKIWESYNKIKIIAFKYIFSNDLLDKTFEKYEIEIFLKKLLKTKIGLVDILYGMEDDNSFVLSIGPCNLCAKCSRDFMYCENPLKLRYSIESLGGDVDSLCRDIFGDEILYIENGKLPPYMYFVGGLLYDKK